MRRGGKVARRRGRHGRRKTKEQREEGKDTYLEVAAMEWPPWVVVASSLPTTRLWAKSTNIKTINKASWLTLVIVEWSVGPQGSASLLVGGAC